LTARWRGERISNAVFTEIETLTDFDPVFLDLVRGESGERDAARSAKSRDFMQKLADVERQLENVSRFIRRGDESDWLRNDLLRLEGDRRTTPDPPPPLRSQAKTAKAKRRACWASPSRLHRRRRPCIA
jgi:hypothetical protein